MSKKLTTQFAAGTGKLGDLRLTVIDKSSKKTFLVDTGAAVSTIPPTMSDRSKQDVITQLSAANNTAIATYGKRTISTQFGFKNPQPWKFVIADIPLPLLGMDFLNHYGINVNVRKGTLKEEKTGLEVKCNTLARPSKKISAVSSTNHEFSDIINMFQNMSSNGLLPCGALSRHHISTKGPPVYARPRRLNPEKATEVKKQLKELLDLKIIRPSSSNWASPIHLVQKPDGSWRMCGDYRALNRKTVPDRYPVPYLQDFTYILHGCKVFSKVDLLRAFHQVPMEESDIAKTAICTPFGSYEFLRMPFGLRNAAQTQQRLMDEVLRGLPFVFVYLDDILIASKSVDEHRSHLLEVFERIKKFGLIVNLKKSEFGLDSIDFLGHHVSSDGIKPRKAKVEAIVKYPLPKNAEEMHRFLGMVNFYRRFIPHAAKREGILRKLITSNKKKDKTPIIWTPEAKEAFQSAKDSIANAAILSHPAPDAELSLVVDVSDYAIGGALHQTLKDGEMQPLGFFSRRLDDNQIKYSTFDRELEAIAQSIKHFDFWLDGRQFTIFSDHLPLSKALDRNAPRSSKRQSERLEFISQYSAEIKYIPGNENHVGDALSRILTINANPAVDLTWIADLQETDSQLKSIIEGTKPSSLKLVKTKILDMDREIWCDTSTGSLRPFVPSSAFEVVVSKLHNQSHPGSRSTAKLVTSRFVGQHLDQASRKYARHCIVCQRNKIHRHNHSELGKFTTPDARFDHVHMDIVGPLPTVNGQSYLLTMIDRYTKWTEAIPMPNITAETTAMHFITAWVSRFGVPVRITTDQGRQFESELFKQLNQSLGINHLRTSPYHPQSNGLVERFHRTLKAALRCREEEDWIKALPLVLLALRSQVKEDLGASPAQLVYGASPRIPGEFIKEAENVAQHVPFIHDLNRIMGNLRPSMTSDHTTCRAGYKDPKLDTAKFVFVRVDSVKTPLQAPYTGPHLVLRRGDKTFRVDVNSKPKEISVDRLKAAAILEQAPVIPASVPPTPAQHVVPTRRSSSTSSSPIQSPKPVTTRYGRQVIPPTRLGGV